MYLLFEGGLIMARILQRSKRQDADAQQPQAS
jgi:Sec-independent protein secretion pathway component TatC